MMLNRPRIPALLLGLCLGLSSGSVWPVSAIDDTKPAAGAALSSAPIRANFAAAKSEIETLQAHAASTSNPHGVTAAQISAATTAALSAHTGNTSNPHSVTAAQVGALAITSNLSDLNSAATARTNLGLGTAATTAATDYATATHATQHKSGGADSIKIDELAAGTDVTTLNASSAAHGLLPKLSNSATEYLNGQGAWATPAGGSSTVTPGQIPCRLTTESGVPVSTSDRTSQSTIYCAFVSGNVASLYDGSAWQWRTCSSEPSLALSSLTSGKNYDVWMSWSGSACALSLSAAWTDDTTRADAIAQQDGVWVKSGAATYLLVGTIRTTGTSTTEDSRANRLVANAANLRTRPVRVYDATASWQYTTDTYRKVNNSDSNRINVVDSLGSAVFNATYQTYASASTAVTLQTSFGLDSTSTVAAAATSSIETQPSAGIAQEMKPSFSGLVGFGYHYVAPLERSQATGTTTWYGGAESGVRGTWEN